jgi:predicted secreted protein with PEFG-CTERM motif
MKSKIISSFFVVLTLVGIVAFVPSSAFAETFTVVKGNMSNQSCAATNNCFIPNPIQVSPGDTVTWTDTGTGSPHTITSGKQNDNTTGSVFDSQYLSPGQAFSHTFTTADIGTINYFDEIHPWLTGQVIVVAGKASGGTNESGTGNNNTIPEFGPIASLVLVIAIVSVVAVTAKTRGFLKL